MNRILGNSQPCIGCESILSFQGVPNYSHGSKDIYFLQQKKTISFAYVRNITKIAPK